MPGHHYVLDTNVLIDWWTEHYPPETFPSLRDKLDNLVKDNRIHIIDQVWAELENIGDDELFKWCTDRRSLILRKSKTTALTLTASDIKKKYPSLIDAHRTDAADPYLIAYTQVTGSYLVTHETPHSLKKNPTRQHYIPDVCRDMNINWIRFVNMLQMEKWTF